jgi:hypothetical protein
MGLSMVSRNKYGFLRFSKCHVILSDSHTRRVHLRISNAIQTGSCS